MGVVRENKVDADLVVLDIVVWWLSQIVAHLWLLQAVDLLVLHLLHLHRQTVR